MRDEDKKAFTQLLADVMAGYGQALPDAGMVATWFKLLAPFEPRVIAAAFAAYATEQPDFEPKPNGIAARARLLDGRPGAEEAFALALTTLDEQNTVVWTQECAEAFAKVRPVLESSGAISARKTFIEIYGRLVAEARLQSLPVNWFPSPGLDKIGYVAAIKRATAAGLLPAPTTSMLLEAPKHETFSLSPRQQLDHIRKTVLDGIQAKQARADAEMAERIDAEKVISAEIQRKVDEHMGGAA